MKTTKILMILVLALGLVACLARVSEAGPMGTGFTYEGHLYDANHAADGEYDFQFKLYDDPCTGSLIAGPVNEPNLYVIDGYFTVELDFGSVFDGDERWLEIGIRPGDFNDPCEYTILQPRQEVTPTPYAVYAETAGSTPGGITGSGTANYIPKFTSSSTIGNSVIYETVGKVGIGKTSPPFFSKLEVHSDGSQIKLTNDTTGTNYYDGFTMGQTCSTCEHVGLVNRENAPLSLWTNYIERMRIDADGNVGIGTTDPDEKLHVEGTIEVDQKIQANDSGGLELATDEGSTRLFIKDNGNVGIGTTNPGAKLEVNGQIKITGGSPGANKVLTSNASGLASWQTPSSGADNLGNHTATQNIKLNGKWLSGDGGNEGVYVASSGHVGIGTTDPEYADLQVHSGAGVVKVTNPGTGTTYNDGLQIGFSTTNSTHAVLWNRENADIRFGTNATERMRITNAGRVGIGTRIPPNAMLDVGTDIINFKAVSGTASANNSTGVYGRANGTDGIALYGWASGNYGIGTYSYSQGSNGVGVRASGTLYDFYAAGTGTDYGSSSSIRWKDNIQAIDDPLGKVQKLRGVYYDWDTDHGGQHDVGMIAEEVGEVLPEIVDYEENGIDTIGMDYSKLTPLLVEAIKTLKTEKDAEIAELKAQNDTFKQRIEKLEQIMLNNNANAVEMLP